MKIIFKTVILAIVLVMVANCAVFAQGNVWKADGNDNINPHSKLGSTNNADVNIISNDTVRIKVGKDGTTEFFGKVKMTTDSLDVNGFIQTDSLNVIGNMKSDSLTVTGGTHIFGVLHVGQNSMSFGGSAPSLTDIITSSNGVINFGNSGSTFSDIKLGIGTTTTITDVALNVVNDINVDVNKSYRIGGTTVLSNKGTSNIFVGEGTGINNSGVSNSFIGYKAGYNNLEGTNNSFVGKEAGYNNLEGSGNSYLGTQAGYNNINGSANSFVGCLAGYNTSGSSNNGSWNSFFGYGSGMSNTIGQSNSFFGFITGYKNTTGRDNSFFGNGAGYANVDGSQNSFFGNSAGNSNTTGSYNSFVGYQSGYKNVSGTVNTYLGVAAGYNNISGSYNSFVGFNAGYNGTSGSYNSFVGYQAGYSNTGNFNSFFGHNTGYKNTSGIKNSFFGFQAGHNNISGSSNSFVGYQAGFKSTGGNNSFFGEEAGYFTTGSFNSFIGYNAGSSNTTGSSNLFVGSIAGSNNTTGDQNTYLGTNTGLNNTTGSLNTYLGYNADGLETLANATAIGAYALVEAPNSMVLGNGVNVGIGTSTPDNRLEVATTAVANTSGLRLTTLASVTPTNTTTTALTVDANGDVILANIQGGTDDLDSDPANELQTVTQADDIITLSNGGGFFSINDDDANSANELNTNFVLSDNILSITDAGSTKSVDLSALAGGGSEDNDWTDAGTGQMYATNISNNVAIGQSSASGAKLSIVNNTEPVALYMSTDASTMQQAYGFNSSVSNGIGQSIGFQGSATSNNSNAQNYGLIGNATGASIENIGITGQAMGASNINVGIKAFVSGGQTNIALVANTPTGTNNFAGIFQGNVRVNGELIATTFTESDILLKQNLQPISNSLNLISQLNPQTFNFRTTEFPQMRLPQGELYGLVAQDVETVLPDLVIDAYQPADIDTAGNVLHEGFTYKALNYNAFIPILIQSVKDQQTIITAQQTKIDSLENRINSLSIDSSILARLEALESCVNNLPAGLCGNDTKSGSIDINSVINITPDNSIAQKETMLEQNVPNPFTIKTTFNYSLGTKGNVELEIITYSGQFVTTLVNSNQEEGSYSIDWNTSDIAPGIYFYTLRVDGVEWVKKAIRIK